MTATLDGYTLGRTLGEGFSSKVKIGVKDGIEYALKIFKFDEPQFVERSIQLLKKEVEALT